MRHAITLAEHRRRERLALIVRGFVEGVVLVFCFVALCAIVVALFVALAPSGASLPGVTG